MAGKYQEARPYSTEAILMYAICIFVKKEDIDTIGWTAMGVAVRQAVKMGYHRDPRHLPNISPFEGEMRRRTFALAASFDALLSFQTGLPAVLQEEDCDTEFPRHLLDTDFDEDSLVIPPSRPLTDPTPMLYFCYKTRLVMVYRRITRQALSLKKVSHQEIMELDREFHAIHNLTPPSIRQRPLCSSVIDGVSVIIQRACIDMLYQEGLCVLHRRFLSHEKSNPEFDYSRKTCISAALEILKQQADMYYAYQPGGVFHGDSWMLSSLSLHGFLLAAMIISLSLYESHHKLAETNEEGLISWAKRYEALSLSHKIWISRVGFSKDARRGAKVLGVMLSKLPRPPVSSSPVTIPHEAPQKETPHSVGISGVKIPTNSEDCPLWQNYTRDISSQEVSNNDFPLFDLDLDPLFDEVAEIDWVSLLIGTEHYFADWKYFRASLIKISLAKVILGGISCMEVLVR